MFGKPSSFEDAVRISQELAKKMTQTQIHSEVIILNRTHKVNLYDDKTDFEFLPDEKEPISLENMLCAFQTKH